MSEISEQKEINSLQELLDWIDDNSRCYTEEVESESFVVHAPCDAIQTIYFDKEDDIDTIISKTCSQLEDFDADEKFDEYWSVEFGQHNHFRASQFLKMLQDDEKVFTELAEKLEQVIGFLTIADILKPYCKGEENVD